MSRTRVEHGSIRMEASIRSLASLVAVTRGARAVVRPHCGGFAVNSYLGCQLQSRDDLRG